MDRQSIESRRAGTARRRLRRDAVARPAYEAYEEPTEWQSMSAAAPPNPPATEAPAAPAARTTTLARRMSRPRMLLAYAILAGIALGHVYEIVTGHEHWPFTHYGMFSSKAGEVAENYHLVGIPVKAGQPEVPIRPEYFPALPPYRVARLLDKHAGRQSAGTEQDKARVRLMVRQYLDGYERHRLAGDHAGPPLKGMRLYRHRWTVDPSLHNRDEPDAVELMLEFLPDHTSTEGKRL